MKMRHLNKFNENSYHPDMREVEPGVWKPKGTLSPDTPMRKFVVTTTSESSDHYIYFIEHPTEPTGDELERFLMAYGSDKDEDQTYEEVQDIQEIKNFQKIPR
jgi:hypothetical protein